MQKLEQFIRSRTAGVMQVNNQYAMRRFYDQAAAYYKKDVKKETKKSSTRKKTK